MRDCSFAGLVFYHLLYCRETLNCGEITVFQAAREWATAECARKEREPTAENMR